MPRIVETPVYRIEELSDSAKDVARAWYRTVAFDDDWYGSVYDEFERIAEYLGIHLKTRSARLFGNGRRDDPCIWFSGFWSQGDGACWEGWLGCRRGGIAELRAYAPKDAELHRIAAALQEVQRRNFYQLTATVTHRGRYYHAGCMDISVNRDSPGRQEVANGSEGVVVEALRDLARWLYRQLEQEHDYLASDDVVDEAVQTNDYTFTAEGRRFG